MVGFAAESQDLLANASSKLEAKNLDMIVANDITARDAGFGAKTNQVTILTSNGAVDELPTMTKAAVADAIFNRLCDFLPT